MLILALDPSLNSTGWALSGGALGTIQSGERGMVRLHRILQEVEALVIGEPGVDLVVMEGYSYASRGSAIVSIGELGGVLRYHLWRWGMPTVEISPAARAKYATGKGNARKEQVLVEAVKRLGYTGHSTDEADAAWLLAMALDHYGLPGAVVMPAAHREALRKVAWPAGLERRVA